MNIATGFSGIEGFGLAAQRCGMDLVAMAEVDRFCCKVLAHRFPGVPNLGDIRHVHGRDIGAVDIWAGGCGVRAVLLAILLLTAGSRGLDSLLAVTCLPGGPGVVATCVTSVLG